MKEKEHTVIRDTRTWLIRLLEEKQEQLTGRSIVLELCREETTDFERGKVLGRIEMLTQIMMDVAANDNDKTIK